MAKINTQSDTARTSMSDVGASLHHFVAGMLGRHHLVAEVSSAAAQFDGLIDLIERAGWDIAQLEQVRHGLDEMSQSLINELIESYPEMSESERQSFLAPFRVALRQFAGLTSRERVALRAEYTRFRKVHARVLASYASESIS